MSQKSNEGNSCNSNTKVLEGINGQPSTACNVKEKNRKHMTLVCSVFNENNQQHSMQLSDISCYKFFMSNVCHKWRGA